MAYFSLRKRKKYAVQNAKNMAYKFGVVSKRKQKATKKYAVQNEKYAVQIGSVSKDKQNTHENKYAVQKRKIWRTKSDF